MATKAVQRPQPGSPGTPRVGGPASATQARRQPVAAKEPAEPGARCAEVAGGTAAECAAVICCCPCALLSLLILAAVRLPAGLCRRAMARRRRKKRASAAAADAGGKKPDGLLGRTVVAAADDDEVSTRLSCPLPASAAAREAWPADCTPSPEVVEMEREMWARFYSTGFWRSPSQREER